MKRSFPVAALVVGLFGCQQDYEIAVPQGSLEVLPRLWDAGRIHIGEERVAEYTLKRLDGQPVQIQAVVVTDLAGGFFASEVTYGPDTDFGDNGFAIAGEHDVVLQLAYHPTEVGWHAAQIEVVNNSLQESVILDARGRAVNGHAVVRPSLIEFGPVAQGDVKVGILTVDNDGQSDVIVEGGDFSYPSFSFVDAPPFTIAEGESKDLEIQFVAPDEFAIAGSVDLQLADGLTVSTVLLRANDCELGDPTAYDVDGDGYTPCGGDCDDADFDIHPGVVEVADDIDQDCDGYYDEETSDFDDDDDGYTEDEGDCNDGDAAVNPGVTQIDLNGVDDDCDGFVDPNSLDHDGDGYAVIGGDCDDSNSAIFPAAVETANSIDDDCDGVIDEGTTAWDDDGDGLTEAAGDCNDADVTVYAGASELADGADNDCDGDVDEGTSIVDDDGDGFTEDGGDCDDADAAANPGELEVVGNSKDDDCDGVTT